MMRVRLIVLSIFILSSLNAGKLSAAIILPGENNSLALADELSLEVLQNPSGALTPFYIEKLVELAPAAGKTKISTVFNNAIRKLNEEGKDGTVSMQLLRLAIDKIETNCNESIKSFSVIKKWNVSGPWSKYGKADMDYEFSPERMFKIENIEKGKNVSADDCGFLYPYKYSHGSDEVYYATCSFQAEGGIVLWIFSDAEYRLAVNGREILCSRQGGKATADVFSLQGAKGYTLQVKMQCRGENTYPYLRVMITDTMHRPVKGAGTSTVYNYNYTAERIFSSGKAGESVSPEAAVLTEKMKLLIDNGDYAGAYKTGSYITDKFPDYFPAYEEYILLLDIMNREAEFHAVVEKFSRTFPDSAMPQRWLADFYMTRDKAKFLGLMQQADINQMTDRAVESYVYYLCGEKKYSEALALSAGMRAGPGSGSLAAEIIKASGDSTFFRKFLIERAAEHDEADLYYQLGLADLNTGLDPVMYWKKGYSIDDNPSLMHDLSDIYENSVLGPNDYYTGIYTDLHPEFSWNGKKRKISVHIFESGRVVLEGEDTLPSGKKLKNKKYVPGETEFKSGEIKTTIPYINGVKVLYVITAKDGLPQPVYFNTEYADNNRLAVKYKISGSEEFSVIRYSGEYSRNEDELFTFLNKLILKNPGENLSHLEYEVICHGNFTLQVKYRGESLNPGRFSDGIVKFETVDRFDEDDNVQAASEILKFSSDREFAVWYKTVSNYAEKNAGEISVKLYGNDDMGRMLKGIHFSIMSSVLKRGIMDLSPDEPASVFFNKKGTAEERTIAAKTILEKKGIKSFISFRKNKEGLIDKILLYVPEKRDRGFWLDFTGYDILEKSESVYEAIVITGEGFETFPVNPETCIR